MACVLTVTLNLGVYCTLSVSILPASTTLPSCLVTYSWSCRNISSRMYIMLPGLQQFTVLCAMVSCGKSSQCRMTQHASSLEQGMMTTSCQCWIGCISFLSSNKWPSNWHAWCTSRSTMHQPSWLTTSSFTFLPPGHASFHTHTTSMQVATQHHPAMSIRRLSNCHRGGMSAHLVSGCIHLCSPSGTVTDRWPQLWNSLPVELQQRDISFREFRQLLKRFLFRWD